jgi:outer membrane immunogenic protein
MRRLAVAGAAALSVAAFANGASAADLPMYTKAPPVMVAPVYNWSGFYIGANGGGAWSRECYTVTSVAGVAVFPSLEGCHDATGGVVGGQLGYRWQASNFVFGVEAQGDWADLTGSNPSATAIIPYMNQTKVDGIGLLTGQVGYAWNNVLLYVKGGAAVTDDKYSSFFTATGIVWNQASETRWGGAAGAGLEFGFAGNWSIALEYDHLFMGQNNVIFPPTAIAVGRTDTISQSVDMATVRLNYRFGGPVVAKY